MKTPESSELKIYDGPLEKEEYDAAAQTIKLPADYPAVEILARANFNHRMASVALDEAEKKIENDKTDELTGLLRYDVFTDQGRNLIEKINRARRREDPNAVLVIGFDVVGLGDRNRDAGQEAGDIALQSTAQTLRDITRSEKDILGRRGGDEFVVMMPFNKEDTASEEMLERIKERLDKETQDKSAPGLKVGFSFYESGQTLKEVLKESDPKNPENKEKVLVTPAYI